MRKIRKRPENQRPSALGFGIAFIFVVFVGFSLARRHHDTRPAPIKQHFVKTETKKPAGRIAIIIDDLGYNLTPCEYFRDINGPLTVSVLPKLTYSASVANCAHAFKKEVLLHLPLEPHHNIDKYPKGYIITTAMNETIVRRILNEAISSVPYVVGINNHMGSKATEDKRVMGIVFLQLKKQNLFFVDSLVTDHSVCPQLAKEMRIAFTQRDVFLDNELERSYIENQFRELAQTARKQGYAIGIGHPHELTLQILKEQVVKLRDQGFDIVTVRDIINRP